MLGDDRLNELCALNGIEREYWDIFGNRCEASREAKVEILRILGQTPTDDGAAALLIDRHREAFWLSLLPPVWVQYGPEEKFNVQLNVSDDDQLTHVRWEFQEENGRLHSGLYERADLSETEVTQISGRTYRKVSLPLPAPGDIGYHQLRVWADGRQPRKAETTILYAPRKAYLPEALRSGDRVWGVSLQLYSLRSERSWGIGDFADLSEILPPLKEHGVDVVGLNPLHALFSTVATTFSPYSPNSRLVLNHLYLAIAALEDFRECDEARRFVELASTVKEIRALQALELIDYGRVLQLKGSVLEILFRHFSEKHLKVHSTRAADFLAFVESRGEALWLYAVHEAIQEKVAKQNPQCWGWPVWPEHYRDPHSDTVTTFAREHLDRVRFYQYVQWLTWTEFHRLSELCVRLGMKVGLYTDLALGANGAGAEAWGQQEVYAFSASMGAPPDELGPLGQDWGLPPMLPQRLLQTELQPFIAALRQSMAGAGAIRIDHVMSLYRLYWIPQKLSAKDGAYVRYPFDALLATVAIESQRNQCLVIGEDLGTVPEEVRYGMNEREILSYKVLYFMKHAANFNRPEEYPSKSLVVTSTHDLATLASYWQGYDLETRKRLGLFPDPSILSILLKGREEDRRRLLQSLQNEGLLPMEAELESVLSQPLDEELCLRIHQFLAKTKSVVQAVQLEDICLLLDQANVPGTVHEHPNWQRRMSRNATEIIGSHFFQRMAEALSKERSA